MQNLRYPVLPYPKGENQRYTLGVRIVNKVLDTRTGIIHDDTPALTANPYRKDHA